MPSVKNRRHIFEFDLFVYERQQPLLFLWNIFDNPRGRYSGQPAFYFDG
jgi:hypothetical protein